MNEKRKAKLLKVLNRWGVSSEEAGDFLADYNKELDTEEEEKVDNVAPETPESPEGDDNKAEPEVETSAEEKTEVKEKAEPESDNEEKTEESVEEVVKDKVQEEPLAEDTASAPQTSGDQDITLLKQKIDAMSEVIESLKAQNSALLTNLHEAGFIDIVGENKDDIGNKENVADSNAGTNNRSENVLRLLNR